MITTILSDFSRVILFPKDPNYEGTLNGLYQELAAKHSDFNFYDYFVFNDELLKYYQKLKTRYSMSTFTTGSIQKNSPEVRKRIEPIFDHIFAAQDYGLDKRDPQAYVFVAKKLKKKPEEILYIDDREANIEASQKAGMKTILFVSNQDVFTFQQGEESRKYTR